MTYNETTKSRQEKVQQIEAAMAFLEDAIETAAGGEALVPIYLRLEHELRALKVENDIRDRIRHRRTSRTMPLAA